MPNLRTGKNDLLTVDPQLVSEWHPTKNGSLIPSQVTAGTNKKVWWLGKCGHEWEATVASRHKGVGCPYCAGKRVIVGVNDLATVNPELAAEWHPTKNGNLLPAQVKVKSNKKVWWKCAEGHEWEATVCSRTNGNGCPYCSNKKVLVGYNDLATTRPDIASEWHPVKNEDLLPTQFTYGSEKKVWWLCSKCGNEWETTINNRTNRYFSTGCPKCSGEHATSFPEQALFYYAQRFVDKDAQSRCKVDMSGSLEEVDVWMPSLKCGIEYDGEYYHARREDKDREKDSAAKAAGIRLIRLIECDRNAVDGDRIYLNVHHHQKRNIA